MALLKLILTGRRAWRADQSKRNRATRGDERA